MNAISAALQSIRADKAKELQIAKETRDQVFQAIVREALGQTQANAESDVTTIRLAIERGIFSPQELEELTSLAQEIASGMSAKDSIGAAHREAADSEDQLRAMVEQQAETRRVLGQALLEAKCEVSSLQHRINRIVQIKRSHPELYEHWARSQNEPASVESNALEPSPD